MRVLITGVTGFVGSHLVDYLLDRGHTEIWGTIRWRSKTDNIDRIGDRLHLFECDLRDSSSVRDLGCVPRRWNEALDGQMENVVGPRLVDLSPYAVSKVADLLGYQYFKSYTCTSSEPALSITRDGDAVSGLRGSTST